MLLFSIIMVKTKPYFANQTKPFITNFFFFIGTFVSLVLNVIVFGYNGLKQSLILQTKQNRLLQISFFFHRNFIYVYFKKVSCAVCGEAWVWVWHYISHICWHLLFCFVNLHQFYQGHIPRLKRKSWQSLYI